MQQQTTQSDSNNETVEKLQEEHKQAIIDKDAQIKELRGSRGKIQLMFALSIKLR